MDDEWDLTGNIVYLLCIGGGRAHYVGYSNDLARRFAEHQHGGTSAIIDWAHSQDLGLSVTRAWELWSPDAAKDMERWLKQQKNAGSFCPHCSEHPRQITTDAFIGARERYEPVLALKRLKTEIYNRLLGQGYPSGEAERMAYRMARETA